MSEFRTGDDPDPVEKEVATEVEDGRPEGAEWFKEGAGNPATLPPPDKEADPTKQPDNAQNPGGPEGEAVYTAVLLVQSHDGTVMPITNLAGFVNTHHAANPHEVFRMCADVQDQISSMRIIGEGARATHEVIDRAVKEHNQGQLMAQKQLAELLLLPVFKALGIEMPKLEPPTEA